MRTFVAVLVLLSLVATAVYADPFTGAFDTLTSELEQRRDNDFGGELDKAAKKQQKAVTKSLGFIAKDADDLGDDIKTAKNVVGGLRKPYASELATGQTLGDLIQNDVLGSLRGDVAGNIQSLEDALGSLSTKGAKKVQKAVDSATAAVASADASSDALKQVKLLGKAYKAIRKGEKLVAKDKGNGGGGNALAFTLNGVPYSGPSSHSETFFGNVFQFAGDVPVGEDRIYIYFQVENATSTGTFPLPSGARDAFMNRVDPITFEGTISNIQSGSVTITTFSASRMAGTFAFTAEGGNVVTGGSFETTDVTIN